MNPSKELPLTAWLPTTLKEVKARGWDELDVILFSGDAYVDHPSFGTAVIGRVLENQGLKVAIVPQPNWKDDLRDFKKLGRPRLFFGVTSGVMDSMVNHYTANRRLRSNDAYTAGGQSGFRPDYATKVYARILKEIYPDVPLVIGGVEASLRRFTHYDYWKDELLPSMLVQSGADLMIWGMGEKPLTELVDKLKAGEPIQNIQNIAQTGFMVDKQEDIPWGQNWRTYTLASHEECLKSKKAFAKNFTTIEVESNKMIAGRIVQETEGRLVIMNPQVPTLQDTELDAIYELPFTRLPHPKYKKRGPIPAYEMIKFSVNIHRGCFGGCSFCTISAHQGKFISSRSEKSVIQEVDLISRMPDFKGHISDLGGPSANMYRMEGKDLSICGNCTRPSCIFPNVCVNLDTSHKPLTELYKKAAAHQHVKKVSIGSGIRYDLLLDNFNKRGGMDMEEYTRQLVQNHVSGRLKIAPEHTGDTVLNTMRKPSFKLFYEFRKKFFKYSEQAGLKQQIIPYFISGHPSSREEDMAELAVETKAMNMRLEQVQGFTPTPMTLATVMYYTGLDPYTMKPVYTARTKTQKEAQHMFFFWYKPEFRHKIKARLKQIGRPDLLGRLLGR